MNADSYFEIGNSHWICEDYALSEGNDDFCFAIVCDGCSSSKDTDVGARILAHITKDTLKYMYRQGLLISSYKGYNETFKQLVLKKALEVASTLGIRLSTLDSTLLAVVAVGKYERFLIGWGDGFFIVKLKNGIVRVIQTDYVSNAPYYLSYEMGALRKAAYKDEYGSDKRILNDIYFKKGVNGLYELLKTEEGGEFTPTTQSICMTFIDDPEARSEEEKDEADMTNIDSIFVTSDGLNTYELGKNQINWLGVFHHIIDIKNPLGEFVKRRMRRVKRDLDKGGTIHQDDISVAAIHF